MIKEKDYLGDQIGWSVRRLLTPVRELHQLDAALMGLLPRQVRNIVCYVRLINNLAPTSPDPKSLFDNSSRRLGQVYLDINPAPSHVNTIHMPGIESEQIAHSSSHQPDDLPISVRWTNKVRWANLIMQKVAHGQPVSPADKADAANLLDVQSILESILKRTEFEYDDRGLPPPDFVSVRKSIFPK